MGGVGMLINTATERRSCILPSLTQQKRPAARMLVHKALYVMYEPRNYHERPLFRFSANFAPSTAVSGNQTDPE